MERFVCVHGHFYQPPRENPWIEAIERQPSAGSHHDWNYRIARECYNPNGAARVVNARNQILDLVNNYARISFNFGPTLLTWYEKAFPAEYGRLIEADRRSQRRLQGHGNAIAQAYHHMILPLCNERDRVTQVRWGLADFRRRFARAPEAMWLPETACNLETLRVLAEHGMKYAILAPGQAERMRVFGEEDWTDVSNGSIDPKRPYRCYFDKEKYIDIFFYDGQVSSAIAFEHLMTSSAGAAGRFLAAFDPKGEGPQLVGASTDGESYGHHEPFSDMGLAHLIKYDLPARQAEVVNFGYFLEKNPPRHEVEIKAGPEGLGTAWSCAHGVARWRDDCGCGADNGRHQKWRKPLREALDWLRDELAGIFERASGAFLKDPWSARDEYIDVLLDRSEAGAGPFFAKHLRAADSPEKRVAATVLLEMQRHAMMMYTSCGWFFSDVSGIETVQNLKYAARAIQLAKDAGGAYLEQEFLARLKRAPGNLPEFPDGWAVYEKLVRPSIVTEPHIAAQHAMAALIEEAPQRRIHHYEVHEEAITRNHAPGLRVVGGRAAFRNGITGQSWRHVFMAVSWPDQTVEAYVRADDLSEAEQRDLARKIAELSGREGAAALRHTVFKGRAYTLRDLFHDERARMLHLILRKRLHKMETSYQIALDEQLPLAETFSDLGIEIPPSLRALVELALGHWLFARCHALLERWDSSIVAEMSVFAARIRAAGLNIPVAAVELEWQRLVLARLAPVESKWTPENLAELRALIELSARLGLSAWRYQTENRYFRLLSRHSAKIADDCRGDCAALAALLNIAPEALTPRRVAESAV